MASQVRRRRPGGVLSRGTGELSSRSTLQAEMDAIEGDDDDHEFPTIPPGRLTMAGASSGSSARTAVRLLCRAQSSRNAPTLREQFSAARNSFGLADVDPLPVREGEPVSDAVDVGGSTRSLATRRGMNGSSVATWRLLRL